MKIEYGRNKIIGRGVLLTYINYSGCFNSKHGAEQQEKYEFVGLSAVLFDEGRKETVLSEILILEHKLTQNPSSGWASSSSVLIQRASGGCPMVPGANTTWSHT